MDVGDLVKGKYPQNGTHFSGAGLVGVVMKHSDVAYVLLEDGTTINFDKFPNFFKLATFEDAENAIRIATNRLKSLQKIVEHHKGGKVK